MSRPAVLEDLNWSEKALVAITAEARAGNPFDGYDVQQRQGLQDPASPQQWGSVFKTAARRGIIRSIGFHLSHRPTRRGGVCRVWEGTPGYTTQKKSEGPSTKESLGITQPTP